MSTVARHQILARLKAVNPQPKNTDHLPLHHGEVKDRSVKKKN
ncbi:hypothetical protein P4S72_03775 [Vibrio sp. PP-XX7]